MKLILYILFFISLNAYSQIDVRFRPERPLVNEPFNMEITVAFEGSQEPYISFDPGGLTVEGKSKGGVTFATQLINGQFTSQKTISYIYQLNASRAGLFYIRNMSAKIGDKEYKSDNIRVQVLREAEKPKDYFLEAIPSKDNVYRGEGFFVNYYLYTRVPIYNQELKEYPKLNGFLKRFKAVDETPERVERNGIIYQRSKKYSARLFAEKIGKLNIDPLKIQVSVGFGNVGGFGLRDMRNVTLSSLPVEIQSSSTPTENVPLGFTGLVGEHSFNLNVKKTKFLANEPIELSLEINGPGLLEKMDDPVIYSHPDLESFDTRSEIQEISDQKSRKILEYTYLPRSQFNIDERELDLSYFDPDTNQYVVKKITIPAIQVIGGEGFTTPNVKSKTAVTENIREKITKVGLSPISPFGDNKIKRFLTWHQLALILSIIIFIISIVTNFDKKEDTIKANAIYIYKKHLSKGLDYKNLYLFFSQVRNGEYTEFENFINALDLDINVKKYFLDLWAKLRSGNYANLGSASKIKPDKKMFKLLIEKLS